MPRGQKESVDGQKESVDAMSVEEALAWIAGIFEAPQSSIRAATARADIPAWDSLGHLILLSALDKRYGIRLDRTELACVSSVQQILNILASHGRLLDS